MSNKILKLTQIDYEKLKRTKLLIVKPDESSPSFEEEQYLIAQLEKDCLNQIDCFVIFMDVSGKYQEDAIIVNYVFKN